MRGSWVGVGVPLVSAAAEPSGVGWPSQGRGMLGRSAPVNTHPAPDRLTGNWLCNSSEGASMPACLSASSAPRQRGKAVLSGWSAAAS